MNIENYKFENELIWKQLVSINSKNAKIINKFKDVSLKEYLKNLISKKKSPESFSNRRSFVNSELFNHVEKFYPEEGSYALEQFKDYPSIQVSDHSSLLFDGRTFMNNFMYQISARENNLSYLFSKQCNLVKAINQPKLFFGPSYIQTNNDIYKIFNKSKSFLKKSNVASISNIVFDFKPQGIKSSTLCNHELPDILNMINGMKYSSASDAFIFANKEIWSKLNIKSKKTLVPLDENFVSDVLVQYLKNDDPIISSLLFDKDIRNSYIEIKNDLLSQKNNLIIQNTSDFFHYKRGNALIPLKYDINNDCFLESESKKIVNISLTKDSLISRLENREIYADLMFGYIFLELLPDVDPLGGPSQQEYLPIISDLLEKVSVKHSLLSKSDLAYLRNKSVGKLLNSSLIELTNYDYSVLNSLNSRTDLNSFEKVFVDKPLGESVGLLNSYDYFNIFFQRKNLMFNDF